MKRMILFVLPAAVLMMAIGCRKDAIDNTTSGDSRTYVTHYDSMANFGSYVTFSISDSVAVIENGSPAKHDRTEADAAVIEAVAAKLGGLGYTRVSNTEQPDLGIHISRVYSNSHELTYPDFWGDYFGYWDPSYWGYAGYAYNFPGYYGVYQIKEGALSIDILDLKNSSTNNTIQGLWNGLVTGSNVFKKEDAGKEIGSLFAQSGYIHAGQ